MQPQLSVIIVTWNCKDFVLQCLRSIYQTAADLVLEVIVVDNASHDGTVEGIREDFPTVEVIASETNMGFPKANNVGLARAKGRFFLVLNPDTEVLQGTLQRSISFLEDNPVYGCVGVKTLFPDGQVQFHCARQFPTLRSLIFATFFLDKIFPQVQLFRSPDMPFWDHQDSRDVEMIQGAYMLFPRQVYDKIGALDETIPMFFEDAEYCLRILKNGYKIRYLGDVAMTHHVGRSSAMAAPYWIASLRYESLYLFLAEYQGKKAATAYVIFLLLLSPLKLLSVPLLAVGVRVFKGKKKFRALLNETIAGWLWSLSNLFSIAGWKPWEFTQRIASTGRYHRSSTR